MSRWRLTRRLGGALIGVVACSVLVMVTTAMPAAADDDGLRFESRTVYRLDPVADVVQVSVAVTVTHEVPDAADGSYYYFDALWLGVPSEAVGLSATLGDGRSASVSLQSSDVSAWARARIELSPVLRYRQTRSVTVWFTLPDLAPRSDGLTRVNDAVASFAVLAHGDPGLASVEVILPTSFDNEVVGAEMSRRTEGDDVVFSATAIADPDNWTAAVASRNEAALVDQQVDVSGHSIDVRAWPGDPAWSEFVTQQLEAGLPVLEGLIGLPWPAPADGLDIIESVTPYAHGFGGWYDSSRNAIEIGDQLDQHLVLHELSHLWFNGELFTERWIVEGLAEEYGARVVAALGNPPPAPEGLGPDHPGVLPLNSWGDTTVARDELAVQREQFAYDTSWSVIRGVIDEIGTDAMAQVLAAAADDRIAYRGDPTPERFSGPADWRRFVDLLEEVGGSTGAAPLLASTVLAPEQLPLFEQRATARAAYDGLETAGGEWTPPLAVRQAMADWDFDEAAELTEVASIVLAVRGQIAATVGPLGLEVPASLESAYESGGGDLADLARTAEGTFDAARQLASANGDASDDRTILEAVGLWWSGIDAALDEATRAFEDGDTAAALQRTDEVEQLVDAAGGTGVIRVGAAGAVLLVLLVGTAVVRHSTRNRRARPAGAGSTDRTSSSPLLPLAATPVSQASEVDSPATPPVSPSPDRPLPAEPPP